jgi:hypothetical protein
MQTQAHKSTTGPNPMAQEYEKKFQIKLNLGKACTGSAQSFKFLHKIMYKQVHQSAAGSSPLASERKKNFKKYHPRHYRYRQCPGASRGLQVIEKKLQTRVHLLAAAPNPVAPG